jgi:hypothetical protein
VPGTMGTPAFSARSRATEGLSDYDLTSNMLHRAYHA